MHDPLSHSSRNSAGKTLFPVYQVDAFSGTPFSGNPAAVVYMMSPRPDEWMQKIAAEMNLSETAFFNPLSENGDYALRWFTPTNEVDLCGHATLATAHIIWKTELSQPEDELTFFTKSGELKAIFTQNGIQLDFPAENPEKHFEPNVGSWLGENPVGIFKNRMDLFVELENEEAVKRARPDLGKIKELAYRGVILTAKGEGTETDFVSRFFGPAVGVDEDPVTGSAHCGLAPLWGKKLGKKRMLGYQASERGGRVEVELVGERVLLRGNAVTVFQGILTV